MRYLIFIMLLLYNITIKAQCPPSGGTVTTESTNACVNGNLVMLSVTGVIGDIFVWQRNDNNSSWVNDLFNTNQLFFSPSFISGSVKFRVKATCYSTGQEVFSNEITINVNPFAPAASSNSTYADLRHATARFTISGDTYTGFLINHTSNDGRLLFLTTNQPQVCNSPNWNNVVFTWESDGSSVTSTGATFLVSENKMTLLQLNNAPNLPTLTYLGWDIIASPSNGSIACIFESGTSQSISKSIVTANFNAVSTIILNANCSTFSESFGSFDNKVSLWNQGGIVKSGRGAPIIRDNKKVVGVYIAGEEQNCVKGPSYFARLQNSPNIVAYLRDEDETNSATVSMNYCIPYLELTGNVNQTPSNQPKVSTYIKSTQNIANGVSIRYKAGTYIELNPGFSSGTDFIAEIDPCVSNITIIAAKTDDEHIDNPEELQESYNNMSNDNWLKVYPTVLPSGNSIIIESNKKLEKVELKMYDLQSRHVHSFLLNSFPENTKFSVRLPDLPSGVYVLKAINAYNLFTQKIVVQ
jgi:hypothetical protein